MTKIFSFFRTKQADPLGEEEEEPLAEAATAGEYRDLEAGGGASGDETAESGGARRPGFALFIACIVACFVSFIGFYYLLLGNFYLPPEAGPVDGGRVIAIAGGVFLAVSCPVLAGGLTVCCCCRSARGSAASPVANAS